MRHRDNQFVTRYYADRFIDPAESGQIKNDDCKATAFIQTSDEFLDAVFKSRPVKKAGQAVIHHFAA